MELPFRTLKLSLGAGQSVSIGKCAGLALVSAGQPTLVQVGFAGSGFFTLPFGFTLHDDEGLGEVFIKNIDTSAQDVVVGFGTARVTDSRFTLDAASSTIPISAAGNLKTVGPDAHDAPITGAPILNGGEARSSFRTAVTEADISRMMFDLYGRAVTQPHTNPENVITSGATTQAAGVNGETDLLPASGAAGLRSNLTDFWLSNNSATTTVWEIRDGAGGTVLGKGFIAGNSTAQANLTLAVRSSLNTKLVVRQLAAAGLIAFGVGYKGP